jgi:hypothetical protein
MSRNLQKKLSQFEAAPPQDAWAKIADALDNDLTYSQRLYRYETEPPVEAWAAIESSLGEKTASAIVVPFTVRYKTPLRYIAAASIIAATLVFVNLSFHHTAAGSLASKSELSHPIQHAIQRESNDTQFTETDPQETASAQRAAEQDRVNLTSAKRTLAYIRPQSILPTFSLRKAFIPKQAKEKVLFDKASVDNFMVFSDGDGNVMKLPKKLFSLVCCKDGDGSCQVRLQRLRQTLSANMASADFAGMLDMLRQLQ